MNARVAPPPRVVHFVTGGFSGATQVAIDLVRAHRASGLFHPLLVLRRKRQTDPALVQALRAEGLDVAVVPGWSHAATIWQLVRLCRRVRPHLFVAHGFSEHLWGRYAALLAGVPCMVHVEHNSRERYTWWRQTQLRWLSCRTAAAVGVSEGVRHALIERGVDASITSAIPNGIRLEPFACAAKSRLSTRAPGIVMASRFGRQKDHDTLLRALALLRQRGHRPPLLLAGGGKARARRSAEQLCKVLGLEDQVRFLGYCPDVPGLLMGHSICVLSSHYEGMPLSLIEGMAAACAVVGSAVSGIQEVIDHERNGLLVTAGDPASLADALERLLTQPEFAQMLADQARAGAVARHGLALMQNRYESLFARLLKARVAEDGVPA